MTNTCQTRDQYLPSPLLSQKFCDTMPIRRVTNAYQTAPTPGVALRPGSTPGEQRAARSPSASCPNGSRGPLSTKDPPTTAVRGRELFPRPDLRNSARARAGQRGARLSLRRLRAPEAVHPRSEAARGALRAPLMRARAPRCDAGRVPGSGRVLELWRVARGTEMECMYNVHCTCIRMRPWVQRLLHRVSIRHSEEGEEV